LAMPENQLMEYPQQTYISQVAVTPQQALQAYQALKQITKQVLVNGTDYGVVPGTPKPSLLKPGAENLLRFYGLGHRVQAVEQVKDWDNGFFYFNYKVTVVKTLPNGTEMVLAECEGSANSKEKRYRNQDPYMLVNTLQKMAIKRALVGATLQATGASGLFTQDLEDMDDIPMQEHQQPRQQTSSSHGSRSNNQSSGNGVASEKQQRAIFAIAKGKGLDEEGIKRLIQYLNNKQSVSELTSKEASDLIKLLQETSPDELLAMISAGDSPTPMNKPIDISDDDLPFDEAPELENSSGAWEDPLGYEDRMPRTKRSAR